MDMDHRINHRVLALAAFFVCGPPTGFGQSVATHPPSEHPPEIEFGWQGLYMRNWAPRIEVTQFGNAPPLQGFSTGSTGFRTHARYINKRGWLAHLSAELSTVRMGYTLVIKPSSFGFGEEGVDLGQLGALDFHASIGLSTGYVHRFDRDVSISARIGYKRTWSYESGGSIGSSTIRALENGERVTVLSTRMDWNLDGGSFGALVAEVGLGIAVAKHTEIGLLIGADHYPQAYATGTFTVLPEDPQNSTAGTIHFRASAWYVGFLLGVRIPWGE